MAVQGADIIFKHEVRVRFLHLGSLFVSAVLTRPCALRLLRSVLQNFVLPPAKILGGAFRVGNWVPLFSNTSAK